MAREIENVAACGHATEVGVKLARGFAARKALRFHKDSDGYLRDIGRRQAQDERASAARARLVVSVPPCASASRRAIDSRVRHRPHRERRPAGDRTARRSALVPRASIPGPRSVTLNASTSAFAPRVDLDRLRRRRILDARSRPGSSRMRSECTRSKRPSSSGSSGGERDVADDRPSALPRCAG